MFCVKCGTEEDLIDNLCGRCYVEAAELTKAPFNIDITICRGCTSFLNKKQWNYFENIDELIDQEILSALKVDSNVEIENIDITHKVEDEYRRKILIDLKGAVAGMNVEEEVSVRLNLKRGICERCSKIAGKYYESILQIRGEDHKLSNKTLDKIRMLVTKEIARISRKDRGSFISREYDIHSGIDFYLGKNGDGKSLAKMLGSRYGSRVKESSTLVGKKDGKDYYRVTYLVRIPPFIAGDYIIFKKIPWKLKKINRRKVHLINLADREKLTVDRKDLRRVEILGGTDIVKKAVVVSRKKDTRDIIVLHPTTYLSVDVLVPESSEIPPEGGEVNVIVHDDDLYLV